MKSKLLVAAGTIAALSFAAAGQAQTTGKEAPAAAETGQSGQPHPIVEIEPHFTNDFGRGYGIGMGARVNVPILQKGIFPGLDDNVAVGVGLDWVRYGSCTDYRDDNVDCGHATTIWVPAVAQWNLFASPRASIFLEGGVALAHATYSTPCNSTDPVTGVQVAFNCSDTNDLHGTLAIGGRYKFADHIAATLRIGYPYFSLGASYL